MGGAQATLYMTTHRSQRSLQVIQSVRGWTNWPRQVGVGVTVELVVADEFVGDVAVAVGIVCGPIYKVDNDVVYGNVVEQFACTESN